MDILLSIIAFICVIAGLIGCIVPIIPGVLLSYVGLVVTYFCSFSEVTTSQLWILAVAVGVVSLLDYLLPAYLAKRFGGSPAGTRGATVGMIIGMIFFNIPGVIFGPFVGAVIGELLTDKNDTAKAFRVGFGSFLSFIFGTGFKLVVAAWIAWVVCRDIVVALWN